MAGFGLGLAFSGQPNETFIQLYERRKAEEARQQAARQELARKAAEGQDKIAEKEDTYFRGNLSKVHPVYTQAVLDSYDKFAGDVLKLKEQNPYGYTNTPEFDALRRGLYRDVNDYVSSTNKANEIEKLDPNKYGFTPGYEGLQNALQNVDYEGLKKITGNDRGVLTGQPYYTRVNPISDILNNVEKLDYSVDPKGGLQVRQQGDGEVITRNYTRPESAIKSLISDYYDRNQQNIAYQYPQYAQNKDGFVDEVFKSMPRTKLDSYYQQRSKGDGSGSGSGDYKSQAEDILRKVSAVANQDDNAFEQLPQGQFTKFLGLTPTKRSYILAGTPLKIANGRQELNDEIQYVDATDNGDFLVYLKRGDPIVVKNNQFFQQIMRPYFKAAGRDSKYEDAVTKLADEYGVFRSGSQEDWRGVGTRTEPDKQSGDKPKKKIKDF